jgi:hypothetical protein
MIRADMSFVAFLRLFGAFYTKTAESLYREILYFAFHFFEKCAPNRPKADKGGYYIFYSILLKNEPQIGQRPI